MAGTKISDLPSASTLTGAELVPVVQSDVTKKTTITDILTFAGAGTVTSVNVSGGTTGLTATGGPITTSGTITLGGTLDVDNGGTGATTAANARINLLPSYTGNGNKVLALNSGATDVQWTTVSGTGTVTSVNVSGGSTGLTTSGGPVTGSGTITLAGTLAVGYGGTGATTAPNARINLLPSYSGNNGKVLALNSGGTDVEWISAGGTGTVTSVDVSGGTTGLSFTGGPITASGTITAGGTLAVANGGTGATTAGTARTNLGAAASGANSDITSLSGITGGIATTDYVDFDTVNTPASAVGRIFWDGGTTMSVGMTTNVVGKVNESLYIYVKASAAITKGQVIVQDGAVGASGTLKAKPSPTSLTDAQTILGVAAEDIALNAFGLIQTHGYLSGLNTTGSSVGETWADGDQLYYNPAYAGGLTKTKPTAPYIKLPMGEVVNAGSGGSGSLIILLGASSQLGGTDSNVQFGTLSNGDLVSYDSTAGYWKNVAQSTITAGSVANALTINNSGTGDASGSTYNGSAAKTISYNSIGASPLAGSSSLTTVGTIGSGTWQGSTIAVGYGGTGATTLTGYVKGNGTSAFTASSTVPGSDVSGNISGNAANVTGTVAVANGGTGLTSGTSGGVLYYSAAGTLASSAALAANALVVGGGAGVAPSTVTTGTGVVTALGVNTGSAGAFVVNGGALGTPSSGTLTNATGLPVSSGISGFGTGVATALAVNTGTAGAFVVNGGALGTPSSGTLTNATGLPISTGVSGLGTNVATFLATPSSANLASAVTDETGSGSLVFATSPTLTTPILGTPTSGNLSNCTADGTNSVGYRNIPQSGSDKTTSYTLATTDVGKFIGIGASGSITVPNSTFAAGDVVSIFNNTASSATLTMSITTAYIAGTNTDKDTLTLATRGVATILFISGTVCVVSGNVT